MAGRQPYVYQERVVKGWCGPAALAMALAAMGKTVYQEELARVAPYDPDWGTDHVAMLHGARIFVPTAYETVGKSTEELLDLAREQAVIVNLMDTEQTEEPKYGAGNGQDGHYVLLDRAEEDELIVMDPNPISPGYGGGRRIKREWFERHFWDIERGNRVIERWALVIPSGGQREEKDGV